MIGLILKNDDIPTNFLGNEIYIEKVEDDFYKIRCDGDFIHIKIEGRELSETYKSLGIKEPNTTIRFYNPSYDEFTNVYYYPLSTDKIKNLGSEYLFEQSQTLFSMKKMGICKNNLVNWDSLHDDMMIYKSRGKKTKRIDDFIESKNANGPIPFDSANKMDSSKTIIVSQGEAVILKNPSSGEGLYTFGAGPCSIVIIHYPYTNQIGLAHIDALCDLSSIFSFLTATGFDDNSHITIISGDKTTTRKVVESSLIRDRVNYMNCDLDGSRNDAAGIMINSEGIPEIVYGENKEIIRTAKNDKQFIQKLTLL